MTNMEAEEEDPITTKRIRVKEVLIMIIINQHTTPLKKVERIKGQS
jgi:hypothetical protein